MPLDPRAKRFLDMVALVPSAAAARPPLHERRRALEKLMQFARADRACGPGGDGRFDVVDRTIPYRLSPRLGGVRGPARCLVFFRGGGVAAGSIEPHVLICRAGGKKEICRLLWVGSRLAPAHPFPAAIEDAIAAVRETARHWQAL